MLCNVPLATVTYLFAFSFSSSIHKYLSLLYSLMEPAQIEWKRIDSRFVEDVYYEHIKAPKWFDFSAPNHLDSIDDDAWFCKPECNHPKRPEDFLLLTPTSSKYSSRSETPGSSQRRGGHALSPCTPTSQESENQNPNLAAPLSQWRPQVKSTSVKKMNKEIPRLKSTESARNLFSGRDIFRHISEFCYELKKLATRVTETGKETHQPYTVDDLELKKERKPLLEVSKEKRRRNKRVDDAENIPVETSNNKGGEPRRIKRVDNAENILMPLKLETVKNERLLQIRTNPPSPQCFSASFKALRTETTEVIRRKEEEEKKSNKEARGLDVLWFLKPCTMAN